MKVLNKIAKYTLLVGMTGLMAIFVLAIISNLFLTRQQMEMYTFWLRLGTAITAFGILLVTISNFQDIVDEMKGFINRE